MERDRDYPSISLHLPQATRLKRKREKAALFSLSSLSLRPSSSSSRRHNPRPSSSRPAANKDASTTLRRVRGGTDELSRGERRESGRITREIENRPAPPRRESSAATILLLLRRCGYARTWRHPARAHTLLSYCTQAHMHVRHVASSVSLSLYRPACLLACLICPSSMPVVLLHLLFLLPPL